MNVGYQGNNVSVNAPYMRIPSARINASIQYQNNFENIGEQGNGLAENAESTKIQENGSFEIGFVSTPLRLTGGGDSSFDDVSNLEISTGSIPLLEQTPSIIDNETPNLSLDTTVDESENLDNSGAGGRTSTQGLLLETGLCVVKYVNPNFSTEWF